MVRCCDDYKDNKERWNEKKLKYSFEDKLPQTVMREILQFTGSNTWISN